ncbi:MAG: metal ABC transporter substrate-binding protein [Lachnospiraceae bacterium]|nr:metal ABC transporter substrate-binding protein [Lachnospiraceae bacterium]
MKKYISLLIIAVLTLGLFSGCGTSTKSAEESSDKIQIVTTIFPEYDWVMNVLGNQTENAEVTMLLDNGVDLHSYEPSPEDVLKITTCDLFIYVGGESDKWVDDALAEAVNEDMQVINLMEVLGDSVSEEEVVEGMQAEEEEGEEGEEEEVEYDEHVWLSLRNASKIVDKIEEALCNLDQANAQEYSANATSYKEQLSALDQDYEAAISEKQVNAILFGDRFPFRYMVDDYDLDYYAAFVGCSAETEASFETVTFLAQKVDELSLPAVLIIDGSDGKIAETIVESTTNKNQQILTMNSMQSTTSDDVENGMSYLSVMKDNLSILKQALGEEITASLDSDDAQKKTLI